MLHIIGYSFKHHIPRKTPQITKLGERKIDKRLHNFREKNQQRTAFKLEIQSSLGLDFTCTCFYQYF